MDFLCKNDSKKKQQFLTLLLLKFSCIVAVLIIAPILSVFVFHKCIYSVIEFGFFRPGKLIAAFMTFMNIHKLDF